MKALLKKDFYVLWTSMKSFLLLIIVFSCTPIGFQNALSVLYAAMIPYSALAYDERSHWDQMALAMPYSARDIVRSKYVLGWSSSLGAFLLTAAVQFLLRGIVKTPMPISLLFVSFCGACTIIAISLPLMFRWSVEKARLAMIALTAMICGVAGALTSIGTMAVVIGHDTLPIILVIGAPILAVAANLISMPTAEKWYERRK